MSDRPWTGCEDPSGAGSPSCRVISEHRSAYPDPLVVRAGERLICGKQESEWPGWLWCTGASGRGGWVPEAYLERRGDGCIAFCDYDATELSVCVGEELLVGEEESGWIWCTNRLGRSGWVPVEKLERLL